MQRSAKQFAYSDSACNSALEYTYIDSALYAVINCFAQVNISSNQQIHRCGVL